MGQRLSEQEQAFVQAIEAEPDKEELKLIYADWLEEQGNPRSELLRLLCQVSGLYGPLGVCAALPFAEPKTRIENILYQFCNNLLDELGDGSKTAVLMALQIAENILAAAQQGVDVRLGEPCLVIADRVANWLIDLAEPPSSIHDLEFLALTAARGNGDIAHAMVESIEIAGPKGIIAVLPAKTKNGTNAVWCERPRKRLFFGNGKNQPDIHFHVVGETLEKAQKFEILAINCMHSTRDYIATGGVAGGGAAYLRCANRLKQQTDLGFSDWAVHAMAAGLTRPVQSLAQTAAVSSTEVMARLSSDEHMVFDLHNKQYQPFRHAAPRDPAGFAASSVRHSTAAAIQLVRENVTAFSQSRQIPSI